MARLQDTYGKAPFLNHVNQRLDLSIRPNWILYLPAYGCPVMKVTLFVSPKILPWCQKIYVNYLEDATFWKHFFLKVLMTRLFTEKFLASCGKSWVLCKVNWWKWTSVSWKELFCNQYILFKCNKCYSLSTKIEN